MKILVWNTDIDGLVQDCSNSIANALELLQSCTKPSIYASSGFYEFTHSLSISCSLIVICQHTFDNDKSCNQHRYKRYSLHLIFTICINRDTLVLACHLNCLSLSSQTLRNNVAVGFQLILFFCSVHSGRCVCGNYIFKWLFKCHKGA